MIDEASIEFLKDNIFSKNTSEYFEEVYSCYVIETIDLRS